jgi:hypothetical protein
VTPPQWNDPVCAERTACPPGPSNETRLMIFAGNTLASGPSNAQHSTAFTPIWRKVKVGKGLYCIDLNG